MKIYTEENVLKMLRSFHTSEFNVKLSMTKLTPIEINEETTFTYSQTEKCPNCLELTPLHSLCLDCIVDIGKSAQINIEISDDEIRKQAIKYDNQAFSETPIAHFIEGAKWYREQLRKK